MGEKALENILKYGKKVPFNKDSKLVFISDVHRSDGGNADDLKGNRNIYEAALNYYYKENYTLVEVGDGDELWENRSFRDIAYYYKDVFKILNRFNNNKRLYMIYGNHDSIKKKKNLLFSQRKKFKKISEAFGEDFLYLLEHTEFHEGIVFTHYPTEKTILVCHGHQIDFKNYELSYATRFLVRYLWTFLEGIGGFKDPSSPASNFKKCSDVDKKLSKWANENKQVMICGHTHKSVFSEPGKGLYFNDGCCVIPYFLNTIEITRDMIYMVKWEIRTREDSTLYIKREIVSGPEPLQCYFKEENNC
ncbi:MAG: metallophosphoesterase [Clostridium sp.]